MAPADPRPKRWHTARRRRVTGRASGPIASTACPAATPSSAAPNGVDTAKVDPSCASSSGITRMQVSGIPTSVAKTTCAPSTAIAGGTASGGNTRQRSSVSVRVDRPGRLDGTRAGPALSGESSHERPAPGRHRDPVRGRPGQRCPARSRARGAAGGSADHSWAWQATSFRASTAYLTCKAGAAHWLSSQEKVVPGPGGRQAHHRGPGVRSLRSDFPHAPSGVERLHSPTAWIEDYLIDIFGQVTSPFGGGAATPCSAGYRCLEISGCTITQGCCYRNSVSHAVIGA